MTQYRDNYQIQAAQAKARFLTYDQQELIERCKLSFDGDYLYTALFGEAYRICRRSGDMQRQHWGRWVDANGFAEVMTILDWLCDSRADRYITGRYVNIVTQGHYFHRNLQETKEDPDAQLFTSHPEAFRAACRALGGEPMDGADIGYAIELLDGVKVFIKLWYGDEDFPAQVLCLWEENVLRYIRYETTWFALGLLIERIKENMPLETKRLLLRPWRQSDARALYEYAKDPMVGPAAGWPVHTGVENSRQIIENVLCVPETYAVCMKEDDSPIGSIGLKLGEATDMTQRSDECELGYWLGKPFWGSGIIPEAAEALLRHAFEDLGMNAVWCGYYEGNQKSCRVTQKLGFTYHHRTEHVEVPLLGQVRTGHAVLLTKAQWETNFRKE